MICIQKSELDKIVQLLIPPLLVVLLILSIIEVFYDVGKYSFIIDLFDIFIISIFIIDLYFRYQEYKNKLDFFKNHYLDIIASIPFNLIFIGIDYLNFTRALRGFSTISKGIRYLRLLKFVTRVPRFLRIRSHIKKAKIRKTQPHEREFKGVLSFKVILLITVNSIMGTGIWFLTASGVKHAGPASLISWLILSLIAVYISMCFSELTSMFPKAGGVYEFAKQTYGRFWSFVVGWTTSIAGSVTISMLLLGALQYMIPMKYSFTYIPVALVLIFIFNFIAYKGMQTSTYMLVTFALITIATITAIIIPGFFQFNINNFNPFFVFPTMNILLAIFFIAETFFGWESAIFLSAETKNPKKVMPKALIIGTIIIAIFSLLLTLTAIGSMPWQIYGDSVAPLKDLGDIYFGNIGTIAFTILVFTSIIGAVASWIVTSPRLLMSIAEDKLFFVQFAKIHPKYKSPYVSIIFQSIIISVLVFIGSGSYETLLHLLIPLILVLYSMILLSVSILRFKKPNLQRPYKAPFGKIGPFITIGFMIFLLYMFLTKTHHALDLIRISASLILFGVPAYFAIELFYDSKYVLLRRNIIAKFLHYYNMIPLPRKAFDTILSLVGKLDRKRILDYDCGVGSFTRRIIKRKIKYKKIYAVDKSKEEIKVFKEKIANKNFKNIDIKYRSSDRIPKNVKKINVFFSFNSLGYVKNISKFLKSLSPNLAKNAKFCFYIRHNAINVTPNAIIVEDENKIKDIFKKEKFKVKYLRKKRFFKEEIFIYGSKK